MKFDNKEALLAEIEKKFGAEVSKNPHKGWNSDLEDRLCAKEVQKRDYLIKKGKEKTNKDGILIPRNFSNFCKNVESCKECGKKYSVNFSDVVYIKKFGLCYNCYIKHNP